MRDSQRTRGTERSGEPAPSMGSFKPVGLLPLPVEPLIWDSFEPVSAGATRKPQSAPHLRKECTMTAPSNQVNSFIAIDAHRHYLAVGGLDTQRPPPIPMRTGRWRPSSSCAGVGSSEKTAVMASPPRSSSGKA
jgi:hypothetical protein